jgi:hypothetical protein
MVRFWIEVEEWKAHLYCKWVSAKSIHKDVSKTTSIDSDIGSMKLQDVSQMNSVDDSTFLDIDMTNETPEDRHVFHEHIFMLAESVYHNFMMTSNDEAVDTITFPGDICAHAKKKLQLMDIKSGFIEDSVFDEAELYVLHHLNSLWMSKYEVSEYRSLFIDAQRKRRSTLSLSDGGSPSSPSIGASMEDILQSQTLCNAFKMFLTEAGESPVLLFYFEIDFFKNIPLSQSHFASSNAHKLYYKYFRIGSKMYLSFISHRDKYTILRYINRPSAVGAKCWDSLQKKALKFMDLNFRRVFLENNKDLKPNLRASVMAGMSKEEIQQPLSPTGAKSHRPSAGGFMTNIKQAVPIMLGQVTSGFKDTKNMASMTRSASDHIINKPNEVLAALVAPTLEDVLRNSFYFACLRKYLKSQFFASLIDFWLTAEQVKATSSVAIENYTKEIMRRFIHVKAQELIPISEETRNEILLASMEKRLTKFSFDKAQKEVYDYLLNNLYDGYLHSLHAHKMWMHIAKLNNISSADMLQSPYMKDAENGGERMGSNSHNVKRRVSSLLPSQAGLVNNLTAVLLNPISRISFIEFSKRTKFVESVYFWLEVQDYRSLPCSDYMTVRGQKIISKYIKPGATMQVRNKQN